MSLLETMEFVFCNDIVVNYKDNMISIVDKNYDYFIVSHGVANK